MLTSYSRRIVMHVSVFGAVGAFRKHTGWAFVQPAFCIAARRSERGGNISVKRQQRFLALVIAVVTLAGVLAGCGPAKGPQKGGTITYGETGEFIVFNPILNTDTPSGRVIDLVYSGLVKQNEKLEMVPDLAEKWTYSDDGLVWTFTLKKGVKWHDGQPFTSADVKYTFDAIKDKDYTGVRATNFKPIVKVEAPDDYTVVLTLSQPYAPLLVVLETGILPKHLFASTPIAQMKTNPASMTPVGTGPYKFKEYIKGQYALLEANADYFDGAPNIQQVIFKIYKDEQVMLSALEKGDIDYMASIPFDQIDRISKSYADKYSFTRLTDQRFNYIGLKQTNPILKDKLVRQALMYGLNRDQIVNDVRKGYAKVMNASILPTSWAYAGDQLNQYKYDPEKAKSLLEQAGWKVGADGIRVKDGKRLSFEIVTSTGNTTREAELSIAQQNWKDIGIEIKPNYIEWSVLLTNYLDVGKFEAYSLGFSVDPDPDCYLYFHSASAIDASGKLVGFNDVEYKNPQMDKLLEEGRTTLDQTKRKEIYAEVQKLQNEELPYVFLYAPESMAALNKKFQNVTWSPTGPINIEKWYVAK